MDFNNEHMTSETVDFEYDAISDGLKSLAESEMLPSGLHDSIMDKVKQAQRKRFFVVPPKWIPVAASFAVLVIITGVMLTLYKNNFFKTGNASMLLTENMTANDEAGDNNATYDTSSAPEMKMSGFSLESTESTESEETAVDFNASTATGADMDAGADMRTDTELKNDSMGSSISIDDSQIDGFAAEIQQETGEYDVYMIDEPVVTAVSPMQVDENEVFGLVTVSEDSTIEEAASADSGAYEASDTAAAQVPQYDTPVDNTLKSAEIRLKIISSTNDTVLILESTENKIYEFISGLNGVIESEDSGTGEYFDISFSVPEADYMNAYNKVHGLLTSLTDLELVYNSMTDEDGVNSGSIKDPNARAIIRIYIKI